MRYTSLFLSTCDGNAERIVIIFFSFGCWHPIAPHLEETIFVALFLPFRLPCLNHFVYIIKQFI